jgi:predicted nucleic acid-binding protein
MDRVQRTIAVLRAEATLVVPAATVRGVAEDEEDDLVLATAVAGGADFLGTGDRYLQALEQYQNVVILSPRQFLKVMVDEADGGE